MSLSASMVWIQVLVTCSKVGFELRSSHLLGRRSYCLSHLKILLEYFFFLNWGLNSHQPFFCDGCFRDRVSQTTCPDWLRTEIFLISAS
jgi:hypothetical protein